MFSARLVVKNLRELKLNIRSDDEVVVSRILIISFGSINSKIFGHQLLWNL